ncbi:hypothetical protein TNCV_1759531 [Trichonephila clavipes]|nr:hypothetical protein TNCV_1759531 [Trichonephila clavipes]
MVTQRVVECRNYIPVCPQGTLNDYQRGTTIKGDDTPDDKVLLCAFGSTTAILKMIIFVDESLLPVLSTPCIASIQRSLQPVSFNPIVRPPSKTDFYLQST